MYCDRWHSQYKSTTSGFQRTLRPGTARMGTVVSHWYATDVRGLTFGATTPSAFVFMESILRNKFVEARRLMLISAKTAETSRKLTDPTSNVRYWKGLSNVQSLTAALGIVAAAWQMCQPPEPERVSNTHRKEDGTHKPVVGASSEAGHGPERFPAPLPGGISEQKKPSPAVTCEVTGQEQKASHHRGSTDGSSSREDVPIVLDASTVATKAHGGQTENSKDAGGAKEKAGIIDGDHKVQTSSSPSDCQSSTAVTLTKKKRRANPLLLGVIGFAAEWDSSSRQACVALIGDWPGIGSLQDLLEGKTAMRRTSQEDLITWTRQVAKGLVKICSSSGGGTSRTTASARGKLLLRISARNVYLFPKPKSEFSQEPKGVLDARVR